MQEKYKSRVRILVFKLLKGISYKCIYPGNIKCKLTWNCFNTTTSMLYYCSSGYDEQFIRKTTKCILMHIFNYINNNSDYPIINNRNWSVGFLVGKTQVSV